MSSKKLLGSLLLSAIALGSFVSVSQAAGKSTTTGDITFTEATGPVDPLDPTDPTKPIDPEDPGNPPTGQVGPLTLDVAPNLPFGTHEITGNAIKATVDTEKNDSPYIQVSDRRGANADGKGQGWHLTVAISDFTNSTQTLQGTQLSFNGTGNVLPHTSSATAAEAPLSKEIKGLDKTDGEVLIWDAAVGQGIGSWVDVYSPENITLDVPNPALGTYNATLTWNLTAGPAA
ncbi:WxL domain-containing protein [Enterococcus timonensis]|uniref:WxL domain-containing protein n=1 Tax=Enterococcus timonensis TaxID=1852364 RepID=UPI0008DACD09|nr:WxL domain-containing protein [Enterococcus timonensis]